MQTRQVVQEFWSRFRDGVFHLAADRQFEEAVVKIAGGYLKPYENGRSRFARRSDRLARSRRGRRPRSRDQPHLNSHYEAT